jgi:peroxiredoxin
MSLRPGDPAPELALPHVPGEPPVRLSDLTARGNVVLLFFPLAWSPTCSVEMCTLRDDYDRYGDLDAEVVGVSVDSPFALRAWAAEKKFPFPLLSDFNRRTSRDYGALYEEFFGMQGVSKRAAFVIDRAGVVRYAEVLENAGEIPDLGAVKQTLQSLS